MNGTFTLPKKERLSSKNAISDLLKKGRWGKVNTLRYCFLENNGKDVNRIMVSVPKKLFKRAIKRNLLKRRIRENYRIRKHLLGNTSGVDIMFVYNAKEVCDFQTIGADIETILTKLNNG